MPREVSPAEELLIRENVLTRRSYAQRDLLKCIGCRLLRAEEAGEEPCITAPDLYGCTSVASGTIVPILHKLEEGEVMVAEGESNRTKPGHPRRMYYLADTGIGEAFFQTLTLPADCPHLEAELS